MTPGRLIQIAEQYERRHLPEFHTTTSPQRQHYLHDRLNHAAFIKTVATLRMAGHDVPSVRDLRRG